MSKKKPIIPHGQVYGYLRVSTEKQNIDNNKIVIENLKNELKLVGPIIWIEEKISGTVDWKLRDLGKWLENSKPGNVLILSELSRISRVGLDIPAFISEALKKGIYIYSLDCPIKPLDNSQMAQMFINGLAMGAQMERDNISVRTKNALDTLKSKGVKLGRPIGSKNQTTKLLPFKDQIKEKIDLKIPLKHIAIQYDVSQQTLITFVKEHNLKPKLIK